VKSESHISEAAFMSHKLAEDKLEKSEAVMNDLIKYLFKHKIKFEQTEAVISGLKNEMKSK
jgi:hypothetical protein